MSRPRLAASARMRACGPTNIGLMIFASAASTAPRSEVSSQGCATAVRTGASAWQA